MSQRKNQHLNQDSELTNLIHSPHNFRK